MKQGTLSFASAKRTNSALNGKSQKTASVADKEKTRRVAVQEETPYDAEPSDVLEISSDEDSSALEEIVIPAKRNRAGTKAHTSPGTVKKVSSQLSRSERQKTSLGAVEREHLDVNRTGRYRKYYNEVRSKMGYTEPIHSEGQNRIHQMLRFFDMTYEFGPCIGMTRLERWERAEAFGLNPPVETFCSPRKAQRWLSMPIVCYTARFEELCPVSAY